MCTRYFRHGLDTFPYSHPGFPSVIESLKNRIRLGNPEVTMALNGQVNPVMTAKRCEMGGQHVDKLQLGRTGKMRSVS